MGNDLPEEDTTVAKDPKPNVSSVSSELQRGTSYDSIAGPGPKDAAATVVPRRARIALFFLVCQGVQMFMSYDGGATPACLDTIQAEMDNAWTPGEFGLLGAMDKLGMTATSVLWGRGLQLCPTKLLLGLGLFVNALCTLAFGVLREKGLMYAAKFAMGATQSLHGVWGTVWTVTMAPPEYRTMWLGLGAVSAGVGNGIGTGVAGFGTANGLPYAFAFQLQAGVLLALWVFLLSNPAPWLVMQLPDNNALPDFMPASKEPYEDTSTTLGQFRELLRNKVYRSTCLAISIAMFQMSGIQFLWVRVFVDVWHLNKNWVTLMFLVVSGAGGGIGIALGPSYIDRRGGFSTPSGVRRSLRVLQRISIASAVAGIVGIGCLYGKLKSKDAGIWKRFGDHWLWMTWGAILLIWAARSACIPALCGINVQAVPEHMRTFASGLEIMLRNILGFACGPLLPGLIMNWLEDWWSHMQMQNDGGWQLPWQLCIGLAFVLCANVLDYFVLGTAAKAASKELVALRNAALQQIREAFKEESIHALERAVAFAKSVELHRQADGEAVVSMATEAIGAFHTVGREAFAPAAPLAASRADLERQVLELRQELARLREENAWLVLSAAARRPDAVPSGRGCFGKWAGLFSASRGPAPAAWTMV
mmetsp:Transcript_52225/g.167401  ORF Transcript_52225/g.167401 Transcript_52225/m.167401 type:complete len:647 (+) Transcript_52225:90-2030(+)